MASSAVCGRRVHRARGSRRRGYVSSAGSVAHDAVVVRRDVATHAVTSAVGAVPTRRVASGFRLAVARRAEIAPMASRASVRVHAHLRPVAELSPLAVVIQRFLDLVARVAFAFRVASFASSALDRVSRVFAVESFPVLFVAGRRSRFRDRLVARRAIRAHPFSLVARYAGRFGRQVVLRDFFTVADIAVAFFALHAVVDVGLVREIPVLR